MNTKKYSHRNCPRVLWEFRKGPKPDCGRDDLVNGKVVPKPSSAVMPLHAMVIRERWRLISTAVKLYLQAHSIRTMIIANLACLPGARRWPSTFLSWT